MAVYVNQNIKMKEWKYLEVEGLETKRITARLTKLHHIYSILIMGAIYHPPSNPNHPMIKHIQNYPEAMLQKYPQAGVILTVSWTGSTEVMH